MSDSSLSESMLAREAGSMFVIRMKGGYCPLSELGVSKKTLDRVIEAKLVVVSHVKQDDKKCKGRQHAILTEAGDEFVQSVFQSPLKPMPTLYVSREVAATNKLLEKYNGAKARLNALLAKMVGVIKDCGDRIGGNICDETRAITGKVAGIQAEIEAYTAKLPDSFTSEADYRKLLEAHKDLSPKVKAAEAACKISKVKAAVRAMKDKIAVDAAKAEDAKREAENVAKTEANIQADVVKATKVKVVKNAETKLREDALKAVEVKAAPVVPGKPQDFDRSKAVPTILASAAERILGVLRRDADAAIVRSNILLAEINAIGGTVSLDMFGKTLHEMQVRGYILPDDDSNVSNACKATAKHTKGYTGFKIAPMFVGTN